jgi:hypothetical protein
VIHSKKKHISIKYHFLREQVVEKNIRVEYVGKKEQVRGSNLGWKDTFSIDDTVGEIHQMHRIEAWFQGEKWSQRCRGQRHVSRGSMSDMTSILHDII